MSRVLQSLSVRRQISDIFPKKSKVYYIARISGGDSLLANTEYTAGFYTFSERSKGDRRNE
jgi:hypothetical protein